ncbi:MAG: helix-turn-helix domain-containing protein [Candidatus Campbellbacteria bacterium]|nr:helix-turn-helix domain-containing protein [Candidatus Campbellbacteria bacterium]
MRTKEAQENICVDCLRLLGDFWTLRIIDALKKEQKRYCEIQRATDNLNPVTLTDRLQKLEKARIIERIEDSEGKISVAYRLTDLGKETLPVLKEINKFSEKIT